MSARGLLLFNLAVNAVGSFVGALALAALAVRLLRVPEGLWRRTFLLMPLVKVVFDGVRGVPQESFFWQKLAGLQQAMGSFQVGLGLRAPLVPTVRLTLGASAEGRTFPQSIAEPLATLLGRKIGPWAPSSLGALLAAVGLGLLARSAWRAAQAACHLRTARAAGTLVERRRLGLRSVRVMTSPLLRGAPCAGGLWRPWVCISEAAWGALSPREREAVILHEIAHIEHLDLLLVSALTAVADLCWFVPGLRPLCRSALAHGEVAADARAVARGACPLALASALVRVAELTRLSPALSLLPPRPTLSERVLRLLAPPAPAPRLASRLAWAALSAWIAAAILTSSTLGNR